MRALRDSWIAVDQGLSSLTNFLVPFSAAMVLEIEQLGRLLTIAALGGTATLLIRAAVGEAHLATQAGIDSSGKAGGEDDATNEPSLCGLGALAGTASAVVVLLIGIGLGHLDGASILIVAALPFVGMLETRRFLYLRREPRAAAMLDLLWLATTAVAAGIGIATSSAEWSIVGWSAGAAVVAFLPVGRGFAAQISPPLEAWHRIRDRAKPLLAETAISKGWGQLILLLSALLLTSQAYGELRLAYLVFSPLNVLAPIVGLYVYNSEKSRSSLVMRLSILTASLWVFPAALAVLAIPGTPRPFAPFGALLIVLSVRYCLVFASGAVGAALKVKGRGWAHARAELVGAGVAAATSLSGAAIWREPLVFLLAHAVGGAVSLMLSRSANGPEPGTGPDSNDRLSR